MAQKKSIKHELVPVPQWEEYAEYIIQSASKNGLITYVEIFFFLSSNTYMD